MDNKYREGMKIARLTFWRVLVMVFIAAVILGGLGFALDSLGFFGRTMVERKVFENSYQRQASLRSRIATNLAVLAEIERKLTNPNLDANTRQNLEAQAAAARIRIRTAKEQLK